MVDILYRRWRASCMARIPSRAITTASRGWSTSTRSSTSTNLPSGARRAPTRAPTPALFDEIRSLFAELPESKIRGYKSGRFSFNVHGGRCEACQGQGQLRIEMQFLPDIYVPCDVCHGARFNRETLQVRFKGLNIAEVLDMTVDQRGGILRCLPLDPSDKLRTLQDVGLGYVRIGQPAPTLSGGEAQRVKLARSSRGAPPVRRSTCWTNPRWACTRRTCTS